MSLNDWEKLQVTRDEVEKIGDALKQKEFRQLLVDYCEEISDPENRKLYEKEITELEKERGVDITFINPEPCYVIKTSSDGTTKTFINIATNEKVDKPSSKPSTNENGERGLVWSLPHTLTPPRRDADKKGSVCHVYDVVFHPDALHLAKRNDAFRHLVNDTAIDAVQQSFKVKLDRTNLKFPKLSYKGMVKPAVIRKKSDNFDMSTVEPSPIDSIYPPMPDESKSKPQVVKPCEKPAEMYTVPKFKIVQRREIELNEMTNDVDAKMNLTIPHELTVTIDLPLLNTTQDANLDVTNKKITLISEKPAKYKAEIVLPYEVDEEKGTARFDKDSGIESDQPMSGKEKQDNSDESESSNESPLISTIDEENDDVDADNENSKNDNNVLKKFLDPNIEYVLPNFTFNQIDDIIAFTLHVKNVDATTIVIDRRDLLNIAHIKFSSIGSGFFPIHYSFCVKFPSQYTSIFREITAEAWDNNVIFQFELNNYEFSSYEAGIDDKNLTNYDIAERLIGRQAMTSQGKEIEDDSLCIEVRSDKEESELVIEVKKDSKKSQETSNDDEISEDVFDDNQSIMDGTKRQTKKAMRKRAKKPRSMSESYCDQLKVINELEYPKMEKTNDESNKNRNKNKNRSLSESSDEDHINANGDMSVQNHHKYKSILKTRNSYSECNESSVDEHSKSLYSISADFGICESHDSLSESCKKQVRFSDIIKRQLFRSNTSILGQKKKNQKKKASRQRAIERRHSEGSESEKHDDDFDEKNDDISHEEINEKPQKRDSGVDLNEKSVNKNVKIKNKSSKADKVINGNDIHFKSGMIFDLEM
ncbi:protein kintoun isoform X2 [Chironomus tepperi]|uniref:protein kintoun isoform X2 n=1 Tax=Chironomus tepperi TaxID=113505 RepID=UPI00391FAEC3